MRYNTAQAAGILGVGARELRKLLREAGGLNCRKDVKGNWEFSKVDIARIRGHMEDQQKPKRTKRIKEKLTEDQMLVLSRKDPAVNKEVEIRYLQRVDRLELRLREAGLHISQISQHHDER